MKRLFLVLLALCILLAACAVPQNPSEVSTLADTLTNDTNAQTEEDHSEEYSLLLVLDYASGDLVLHDVSFWCHGTNYSSFTQPVLNVWQAGDVQELAYSIPNDMAATSISMQYAYEDIVRTLDIRLGYDGVDHVSLSLQQTDVLRLRVACSLQGQTLQTSSLRYSSDWGLWFVDDPDLPLGGILLTHEDAAVLAPTQSFATPEPWEPMALVSFAPVTQVRYWTRPGGGSHGEGPWGTYPMELVGERDQLRPGEVLLLDLRPPGTNTWLTRRHFVSWLDADGVEQVQQFSPSQRMMNFQTQVAPTSQFSAGNWALAQVPPPPFDTEYQLELINSTGRSLDAVLAYIGDEVFPLCENLAPGGRVDVSWEYTGDPFLWDIPTWKPGFLLEIEGTRFSVDELRVCDADNFEELEQLERVAFFQDPDGSFYCSTQEDYPDLEPNEDLRTWQASYRYLPRVRRWLYLYDPAQQLFFVGMYDEREFRALFPGREDLAYPSFEPRTAMITIGDIYLHDAYMEGRQTSYGYTEHTRSSQETLFTTQDVRLFSVDHIRTPAFYFRYRAPDGRILRQWVTNQHRDGNNAGAITSLLLPGAHEYYDLEDIW